jgi:hypothetical protein
LRLLVDAETLPKEYSALINKLFFDGNRSTDTDALLRRYAGKGLNLTSTVDALIRRELNKLPDWSKAPRKLNWKLNGALLDWFTRGDGGHRAGGKSGRPGPPVVAGSRRVAHALPGGTGGRKPGVGNRLDDATHPADHHHHGPLFGISTAILLDTSTKTLHVSVLATMVAWNLAVLKANLDTMRINQSARKIQIRKNMCAARQLLSGSTWFKGTPTESKMASLRGGPRSCPKAWHPV